MQPWTTVLQKWTTTSAYRTRALHSGQKKLDNFKLYADPKADSLVCKSLAFVFDGNLYICRTVSVCIVVSVFRTNACSMAC